MGLCRYLAQTGITPTILTADPRFYETQDDTFPGLPGITVVRVPMLFATPLDWYRALRLQAAGVLRKPAWGAARPTMAPYTNSLHLPQSDGSVGLVRKMLRRHLVPLLAMPDEYWPWYWPAVQAAQRLLLKERFDAILTTAQPWTTHMIGLRLYRLFAIPWLADFRDLWTLDDWRRSFPHWRNRIERRWEAACVRNAARVIVTTGAARDRMAAAYPDHAGKISVLTNGFDDVLSSQIPHAGRQGANGRHSLVASRRSGAAVTAQGAQAVLAPDEEFAETEGLGSQHGSAAVAVREPPEVENQRDLFAALPRVPAASSQTGLTPNTVAAHTGRGQQNQKLILHLGRLYIGRRLNSFCRAVQIMVNTNARNGQAARVLFLGTPDPEILAEANQCAPELIGNGVIEFADRVPWRDTLAYLKRADLLLIIQGSHSLAVPAKFYEYLRTGKPIFAVVAPGALSQMITETGAGLWAEPGDPELIAHRLWQALQMPPLNAALQAKIVERFHYRNLARTLAGWLVEAASRRTVGLR